MPYILVEDPETGLYKVCKKDNPKKCFSKKGLSLNKAKRQMKAIIINEHLKGGIIDKDSFLKRQSKGIYKNLTYEDFVKLENQNRQNIDNEINKLKISNKQYDDFMKENPEYEEVQCNFDENGEPNKNITTRYQCELNHKKAKRALYDKSTMGKIVNGITDIADEATKYAKDIGVPEFVTNIYKTLAPSTSKFKGGNKLHNFLDKINMSPKEYLKNAKKRAKENGYDPKLLKFANDNKHKLIYNNVPFGAIGYSDFIIYSYLAKTNKMSKEEADKKMINYRKRAQNIKGDWKDDKESPNNLAISILWG